MYFEFSFYVWFPEILGKQSNDPTLAAQNFILHMLLQCTRLFVIFLNSLELDKLVFLFQRSSSESSFVALWLSAKMPPGTHWPCSRSRWWFRQWMKPQISEEFPSMGRFPHLPIDGRPPEVQYRTVRSPESAMATLPCVWHVFGPKHGPPFGEDAFFCWMWRFFETLRQHHYVVYGLATTDTNSSLIGIAFANH